MTKLATISKDITWTPAISILPNAELDAVALDWITNTCSLTQRLRDFSENAIELTINADGWNSAGDIWHRDIEWQLNGVTWVIGTVNIPATSLQGSAAVLQNIGTSSLGDTLKTDPNLTRSNIEVRQLNKNHWARRSTFYFYEQPLQVIETFLPEFFAAINKATVK